MMFHIKNYHKNTLKGYNPENEWIFGAYYQDLFSYIVFFYGSFFTWNFFVLKVLKVSKFSKNVF